MMFEVSAVGREVVRGAVDFQQDRGTGSDEPSDSGDANRIGGAETLELHFLLQAIAGQ